MNNFNITYVRANGTSFISPYLWEKLASAHDSEILNSCATNDRVAPQFRVYVICFCKVSQSYNNTLVCKCVDFLLPEALKYNPAFRSAYCSKVSFLGTRVPFFFR